ncbi:hypothetical protein F5Y17DRAFT_279988 [Xylariaceae sp. FL0594]|nr:hypothetical protein F5Y17DRAFT_279988 [Xylariaceae sp. FL0594]
MRNFIGTIAAFVPLALAAPGCGYPAKSCSKVSFSDFSWNVEAFTYHASYIFSTPAHQIASGTVAFNITNPAVPNTKVSCSAYSSQLTDFFYGDFVYTCQQPGAGSKITETTFDYNAVTGHLDVNQTWTCNDQDPKYPITFRALGSANLTLHCKEDDYQNSNWTIGQIYSSRTINCAPVNLPIHPTEKSAVA